MGSSIKDQVQKLSAQIPPGVRLIAVSKFKSKDQIQEAYSTGILDFGENYVQELIEKYELCAKDIRWHFIGHLQSNKVKYIAPFVYMIQSVDNWKLLQEINKQAVKNQRIINCLIQLKIAKEDTKSGMEISEFEHLVKERAFETLPNIKIMGLMGIASFTDNEAQLQEEFLTIKNVYLNTRSNFSVDFQELSIGMSSDWMLAVALGSTIIRIGTSIFGSR